MSSGLACVCRQMDGLTTLLSTIGKSQFESVTLASEVLSNFPTASFFDRRAVTMNQLFCNIDIILSNVSSKTI